MRRDPKRLKTSRRSILTSLIVLACCKTSTAPNAQPPASDDDQTTSRTAAQPPPARDDLERRACTRLAELAREEHELPAELVEEAQDVERCIEDASTRRAEDPEQFEQQAACIVDASSYGGMMKCQVALHFAEPGEEIPDDGLLPPESAPAARRMCERMLELSGEDPRDGAVDACMLDLAQTLGPEPEAYERALECTEGVDTMMDVLGCVVNR